MWVRDILTHNRLNSFSVFYRTEGYNFECGKSGQGYEHKQLLEDSETFCTHTQGHARGHDFRENVCTFTTEPVIYQMSLRCCDLEAIKVQSFRNVRVSNIAFHVQRNLTIPRFIRPGCCTYTSSIPGLDLISRYWGSGTGGKTDVEHKLWYDNWGWLVIEPNWCDTFTGFIKHKTFFTCLDNGRTVLSRLTAQSMVLLETLRAHSVSAGSVSLDIYLSRTALSCPFNVSM